MHGEHVMAGSTLHKSPFCTSRLHSADWEALRDPDFIYHSPLEQLFCLGCGNVKLGCREILSARLISVLATRGARSKLAYVGNSAIVSSRWLQLFRDRSGRHAKRFPRAEMLARSLVPMCKSITLILSCLQGAVYLMPATGLKNKYT